MHTNNVSQKNRSRLIKHSARAGLLLSFLLFNLSMAAAFAPPARPSVQAVETGKFRLHKFQQAIGEESYTVTRDGDALVMKTDFKFVDRGSPVPLTTTLRTRQDLTPLAYEIKGKTSRLSEIDTAIEINGTTAKIREGSQTREAVAAD